tara:strand:+ start:1058 stop:1243 length:186 start_codon:yes stop_codon:yes gene_type:complete
MARRPKGSILRTHVLQSKVTPEVAMALDVAAKYESTTVSTKIQDVLEKALIDQGYLKTQDG